MHIFLNKMAINERLHQRLKKDRERKKGGGALKMKIEEKQN